MGFGLVTLLHQSVLDSDLSKSMCLESDASLTCEGRVKAGDWDKTTCPSNRTAWMRIVLYTHLPRESTQCYAGPKFHCVNCERCLPYAS